MLPLTAIVLLLGLRPAPRMAAPSASLEAPPRPASAAALGPKSAQVALAGSQPLPLRKGTGEFGAAERQRATIESGDLLVKAPNVFRGVAAEKLEPTGVLQGLPLLSKEEEVKLIEQASFFLASRDAQRELTEEAESAGDVGDPSEQQLLARMRARLFERRQQQRVARPARPRGGEVQELGGAVAAAATVAAAVERTMPASLSVTEFRLRESVGRAAYNKLFLHNQGLIYHEVKKAWPNWRVSTVMEKADFLQEGAQGLLRAIRLFDPQKAVRFSTYATWHVRAFVLRAVRDKSNLVRLPQALQEDMIQIRKARYRYAVDSHGHAPTAAQLAVLLGWQPRRVDEALVGLSSISTESLDEVDPERKLNTPRVDRQTSEAHGRAQAESELYLQQLHATLRVALKERDPKRAQITRLKYGLEDGREWSYPQLARRFNVTANSVKGIVRTEVAFLRREKRQQLKQFIE